MAAMKTRLEWLVGLLLVGVVALTAAPAEAAARPASGKAPHSSGIICPTAFQLRWPALCSDTEARRELADQISNHQFPPRPLPLARVDDSLGDVPFHYLRSSRKDGTPLYTSVEDAVEGKNPYRVVDPGFVFFSWEERYEIDGKTIYMIVPGVYIRGSGVSQISMPSFRGLAFKDTPSMTFAWVLARTETRRAPGVNAPKTGHWLNRGEVLEVFGKQRVGDYDWYQVGPEEWVEQRLLAVVTPDPTRPPGVEGDRWISVDLYEQTLMVYEKGQLVYATLVSSGLGGWWTQPGVFQVYAKLESDPMQGAFAADRSDYYYLEDVPWILYYDQSRAIHGTYWHNGYGYPRSHGCVNLSPADAEWVFNWAQEGTWVYVYDPSGETPTDPSLYGAGGA